MGAEGIVCLSHARWVRREGARKLHASWRRRQCERRLPVFRSVPTATPRGVRPRGYRVAVQYLMHALRQRSGKCFFTRMSARVACRKGRSPTTLSGIPLAAAEAHESGSNTWSGSLVSS